jgi:threonine dehydrogenase-like Zn-dependent dehydrogenase
MKAVAFEDVRAVAVVDVPEPKIEEPGDAVVRVGVAAICGSDLHMYEGKVPLYPGETIGHEVVGVVEGVGPGVTRFRPGDRVVVSFVIACGGCWFCQNRQSSLCEDQRMIGGGVLGGSLGGGQAELVRVPDADWNLLAVPNELSDEQALFLGDILTTGYYGAAIAGIQPTETVAVIGAGPVGFFAIQAARAQGAERVFALDMEPDRLVLAERVGGIPINVKERNPQMALSEQTEGRGADVVIEAVGSVPAFESAIEVVRRGGTVAVVGVYSSESVEVPLGVYWARALRLRFSGICPVQGWWDEAMQAVRDGRIDPLPIISHRLPLDRAPEGYELFAARKATKVVLRP